MSCGKYKYIEILFVQNQTKASQTEKKLTKSSQSIIFSIDLIYHMLYYSAPFNESCKDLFKGNKKVNSDSLYFTENQWPC